MTKRTLAALAALLAFMAVLVAVPLATSETAEAHTKTVKRCSYDPFTNVQQCWTETVAHTHRVIPDNPPPDTSPTTTTTTPPRCPAGTTGTPPNCSPIPPTNDPAPDPEDKECPAGTVGTPPNCKTQPPPECPAGQTGTWPNCKTPPKTCPAGQHSNGGAGKNCHSHSFTPPHCGTGTWSPGHGHTPVPLKPCPPPPRCATGHHRHGNTCHLNHDWTNIPCGTGTWAPHAGHTAKQRPPCPTTPPTTTTAPPECPKQLGTHPHLDREQHRHVMGSQRNRGGDTLSACHLVDASHCPSGQHEHGHGSQECHALGQAVKNASGTHSGWTDHCASGEHSHEHSGSCHAADPPYYDGVKIEKIEIAYGYICYTTNTKPHGEVKSCARVPEKDGAPQKALEALEDAGIDYAALALCTATGPLAVKCGAAVIGAALLTELLEAFCVPGFCNEDDPPPIVGTDQKPPPEQDDDSGGSQQPTPDPNDPDGDDDGSGTDDDSGEDSDDDSGNDDSGDGQPKITWAEVQKAIADRQAELITAEEMRKIANGWSCQQYGGHYCRYAQ